MSTSLQTLIQNVARKLESYAAGTCSAAGSTTEIVDTSGDSPFDPEDESRLYANAWVKIESDTAFPASANVGEVRRAKKSGYTPTNQTLAVSSGFPEATSTTQSYGIYRTLPPHSLGLQKGIKEYLNDVLPRLFHVEPVLLSALPDPGFEGTDAELALNWGTSLVHTSYSNVTGVRLGRQSLHVVNLGANGYAQSGSVAVEEGQVFLAAIDVTVASGTAELVLWDITNNAEIASKASSEKQSRFIWLQEAIPGGCREVALRLRGVEATADVYWDNATLLNAAVGEMPLPSWFADRRWLEGVYYWRPVYSGVSGDHLALDAVRRQPLPWHDLLEDGTGTTRFRVTFDPGLPPGGHLIAICLRPYETLEDDDDTTEADAAWVEAWACLAITTALAERDPAYGAVANRWLSAAQRLHGQHQPALRQRAYRLKEWF